KSEFYITASRLLRAFASLFIATAASTPLQAQVRGGRAAVVLTEHDSIRNLTFPNPPAIDLPDLYRSYNAYLQISYDLVRRAFRYDREDISRARINENLAAKFSLRAEIENPFTAKPITMRGFLKWTLNEVRPLAEALNLWNDLNPLVEMSEGGPNTAEKFRT